MKLTHGDPQYLVLYDEHGTPLCTCVSIEARDRLIEAVNRGVGVTDPESDRLVDELFADARATRAEGGE